MNDDFAKLGVNHDSTHWDVHSGSAQLNVNHDSMHTVRSLLAAVHAVLSRSAEYDEFSTEHSQSERDRESREILSALMNVRPGDVSRASEKSVDDLIVERALAAAGRRATGEPLAYCVGTAAFRHLVLHVDSRVLIPRPETEIVVDQALRMVAQSPGGIAVDIGTGSGAIALSLATEGRFDRVIATDISSDALAVASENAEHIGGQFTPIEFREGADFEPLSGIKARVIVSNPPYISADERSSLPASVREWEPALALFAEQGGMARYDALLAGATAHLENGGWLVLEVDSRRAQETARRARLDGRYSAVRLVRDFAGRERVLVAQYNSSANVVPAQ